MTNFYVSICLILLPIFSSAMEVSCSGRRLRMKDWLFNLLERSNIRGLYWEDRSRLIFRIEWKHGSRHGYSSDKDAVVFKQWAEYTGKLKPNQPDPKRWKANFRCALNSLKNVERVASKQDKRADAFRRYQFVHCFENINADHDRKIIKQEPDNEIRWENPIPAFEHRDIKIKQEIQDHQISSQTLNDSFFQYPLKEKSPLRLLTPPLSPEAERVQDSTVRSVTPERYVREWVAAHTPFWQESTVPLSPPSTPPDRMLPDLDIEAMSGDELVRLSEPDVFNFEYFDLQLSVQAPLECDSTLLNDLRSS